MEDGSLRAEQQHCLQQMHLRLLFILIFLYFFNFRKIYKLQVVLAFDLFIKLLFLRCHMFLLVKWDQISIMS